MESSLKTIIGALAFSLACVVLPCPLVAQSPTKPNVILILMDDLGYGDLGSYGASDVRTPNIDRLAREGVKFTESYASGAVCSATRAALITGRYQARVGLEWVLGPFSDTAHGLPVRGASLPALLKKSGYATGLIGKWHLGYRPEQQPNAHGFDEFFGFLGGHLDYYTHTDGRRHDLYENGKEVEEPGYITDVFTTRAVDFVNRHAAQPFFLEVAYNATHMPFEPPPDSLGNHRQAAQTEMPGDRNGSTREDYVRMLERADEGVGKLLSALESRGIAKNTLVIFTDDNGGEWLSRNEPFTRRKGTLWEGGIRVPLIMSWPGRIPAGKVSSQIAMTMDVTATVLAAAGASANPLYPLDGIDLTPIARGQSPSVTRDVFWRIPLPGRRQSAVRSDHWKLVIDEMAPSFGFSPAAQVYLFDLSTDPAERTDLAASHSTLVAELRAKIQAWERDVQPRASAALIAVAQTGTADAVAARYQELKRDSTKLWVFDDTQLNQVGQWFLRQKRTADAVAMFQLNLVEYPSATTAYLFLGDSYLAAGDTVRAIANYRRFADLNPNSPIALKPLKALGVVPPR
jgi:arylsulfatase A-like enzyme